MSDRQTKGGKVLPDMTDHRVIGYTEKRGKPIPPTPPLTQHPHTQGEGWFTDRELVTWFVVLVVVIIGVAMWAIFSV